MVLEEIKKLSKKEFGERYPFVIVREHVKDEESGKWILRKSYWEEDQPEEGIKKGDPCLEFYLDDWHGWSDILLCWAEKVKPIFDQMPKETQDAFYIEQLKEKYGDMRLYVPCVKEPFDKINDYTTMVEHLSTYTCFQCGHLTKSSNSKKLFTWSTRGYWISLYCKKCARKFMFRNPYRKDKKTFLTWLHSHPHFNLNTRVFDEMYRKIEGKWEIVLERHSKEGTTRRVLNSKELLEGMF